MAKVGIIEAGISPHNRLVIVKKKEPGKIRICVELTALNRHMPLINSKVEKKDLFHRLDSSHFLTGLDLSNSYLQIELKEDSRKYFSFFFKGQIYRYCRLLYGYKKWVLR